MNDHDQSLGEGQDSGQNVPDAPNSGLLEELKHFRMVVDFIEKYLSKQLDLMARLRAGKEQTVAFENLWMLFQTHDTVFTASRMGGDVLTNPHDEFQNLKPPPPPQPAGRPPAPLPSHESHTTIRRDVPQAYRVLAAEGGVPYYKTLAPNSVVSAMGDEAERLMFARGRRLEPSLADPYEQQTNNKYSPLFVYCFYVDYDGENYGTVSEVFVFKPFEGEAEIRNLEICPLSYLDTQTEGFPTETRTAAPGNEHLRSWSETLEDRGRSFLKTTNTSHMNYDGFTVGRNREEVNKYLPFFEMEIGSSHLNIS